MWETTGAFPGVERRYVGIDGFVRWRHDMRSAWSWFEVRFESVLHDAPGVLVVQEQLRGRGAGSDLDVEMTIYGVYRFRGGRICGRQPFRDRDAALTAAR